MEGHVDAPVLSGHHQDQLSPASNRRNSEEGSNSTSSTASGSRAPKSAKICEVCGDRAKSYHFGGLSCDSCKAFFRRSVHNDNYTTFHCSYHGSCLVTRTTRKGCQKCRFEKCLSIGMEKKWVMSEQERNALNKQRLERREQSTSNSATSRSANGSPLKIRNNKSSLSSDNNNRDTEYIPRVEEMLNYMTDIDKKCIREVVEYYRISYEKIPYLVPKCTEGPRNSVQIIGMFTTILRRFAYFAKLVPEFVQLSRDDQGALLKGSVLEMCLLRGALSFDIENHRWPSTSLEFLKDCPQLQVEDMQNLVSKDLFEMHMQFILKLQKLKVDEPTVMLLLLVVLFYADRSSVLEDVVLVSEAQEKYSLLLQKYVRWRFGPVGFKLYPQLLDKLRDLRELNDRHTEYNLKLEPREVNIIRADLTKLQLDPWKIVDNSSDLDKQSSEVSRSPEFPPTDLLNFSPLQRSSLQRSMTDAFLERIPSLIDDPFCPLITERDMQLAAQFRGAPIVKTTSGEVNQGVPISGWLPPKDFEGRTERIPTDGTDSTANGKLRGMYRDCGNPELSIGMQNTITTGLITNLLTRTHPIGGIDLSSKVANQPQPTEAPLIIQQQELPFLSPRISSSLFSGGTFTHSVPEEHFHQHQTVSPSDRRNISSTGSGINNPVITDPSSAIIYPWS